MMRSNCESPSEIHDRRYSSGPSSNKNDQQDSTIAVSVALGAKERKVTRVISPLNRGIRNMTETEWEDRTNLWFSKCVSLFSCWFSLSYLLHLFFFYLETILQQRNPLGEKVVSFPFLLPPPSFGSLPVSFYNRYYSCCLSFFSSSSFFLVGYVNYWILELIVSWAQVENGELSGERWSGFFGTASSARLEEKGFSRSAVRF